MYQMAHPHSRAGGVKILSTHRPLPQAANHKQQGFSLKAVNKQELYRSKSLNISEVVPASDKCPTITTQGNIYASRQGRRKSSFLTLQKFRSSGCHGHTAAMLRFAMAAQQKADDLYTINRLVCSKKEFLPFP